MSLNDDRCRVRSTNGLWILGMMRRLVISLFMGWRHRHRKPHFQSLTDFQAAMGEDPLAKARGFVPPPAARTLKHLQAYARGSGKNATG